MSVLLSAMVMALAFPMGWGLALTARRFAPNVQIKSFWMIAGVSVVCACALTVYGRTGGSQGDFWTALVLGAALLLLGAVDITTLRLPDLITLPLALLGLAVGGVVAPPFFDRLCGMLCGVAVIAGLNALYRYARRKTGIGLGDAKLFGAAGAWLGWAALPSVLLLACAGGLIWVAARILLEGRDAAEKPIPFGAPLCLAIWAVWISPFLLGA